MPARSPPLILALLLLVPSAAASGHVPVLGPPLHPLDLSAEWYCGQVVAREQQPPQEPEQPPQQEPWPPKEPSPEEPTREEPAKQGDAYLVVVSRVDVNGCIRAADTLCGAVGMRCCAQNLFQPCQAWNAVAGPWFQVGQEVPVVGGGVCVTGKTDPQANLSVEERNCWERPPGPGIGVPGMAAARTQAPEWPALP